MKSNKAFSFVEIIITVSIIALLGVIGFMVSTGSQEKSVNTRIASDLSVIDNSLAQYKQENSVLPDPKGNMNFFNSGSEYSHSATGAFGVHGFVTENLLPKKYMNYLPLDPKTNDYYAYGKTINNKFYEISGVVRSSGENKAKVSGNYPGETGPRNLIREYNGPNFVSNDSSESFPYNPDERVMTAKVSAFSGSVTITKVGVGSITDLEQILKTELREGDSIKVSVGSSANLYYSDGSNSTLGDSSSESELVFAKMFYKENSNLVTKVQLALINGTLWTKATKLSDTSEFEVLTTDSAAAVRGTIFGVKKEASSTTIQLNVGSLEITDIGTVATKQELLSDIINGSVDLGTGTDISVSEGGTPEIKTINVDGGVSTIPVGSGLEEAEDLDFNSNEELEVDEINKDFSAGTPVFKISMKVTPTIKKSDYFLVSTGGRDFLTKTNPQIIGENLVMTGGVDFKVFQSSKVLEKEKQDIYLGANIISIGTPPTLSSILSGQNKIQISLCKQIGVNIFCLPKKEITLVNYKKVDDDNDKETYKDIDEEVKKMGCNIAGITLNNGDSKYFYEFSTIAFSETYDCNNKKQARTCNNGVLSGDFTNLTCTKATAGSCNVNGITINHNASKDFYSVSTPTSGLCSSYKKNISCNNGITTPATGISSYIFESCTETNKCSDGTSVGNYSYSTDGVVRYKKLCNNSLTFDTPIFDSCISGYSQFKANFDGTGEKIYCFADSASGKSLYAFAPYDRENDFNLYKKDGTKFDILQSGVEIEDQDGETGVKVDSSDYLKYSNLNLGNNFEIEMSVRGEDLNRTGFYGLYNIPGILYLNKNTSNKLVFLPNLPIDKKLLDLPTLSGFKKFIINYSRYSGNLYIDTNKINSSTINYLNPDISTSTVNFFVGSHSIYGQQWNGIINYIKFYK